MATAEPMTAGAAPYRVALINPYELGRQSFNIGHLAAWLTERGCRVDCFDLSLQRLEGERLAGVDLVAIHLGMHTATRIALGVLERLESLAPAAVKVAFGLYAPMNEALLRSRGVSHVLGGEIEPAMGALVARLRQGLAVEPMSLVSTERIAFRVPDRSGLPALSRYAHLILPDGESRTVGFTEASRGCKHVCRHCPVVPVYQGQFRVVPVEVVLADVAQQVAAGAQHISFGDPDFLNGPGHARRVVAAVHQAFPHLSYDIVAKVEHLLRSRELLSELRDSGCLFITSAVESVDDTILQHLDKGHTREDFGRAVALLREVGIAFAPTFVAFTPWTSLEGYVDLLSEIDRLGVIDGVAPVQLALRLLVPEGSYLLRLSDFRQMLEGFDPVRLGYVWRHVDPRVDALQGALMGWVAQGEADGLSRRALFSGVWERAHAALGRHAPSLQLGDTAHPVPRLSEPWYCCAEPTEAQLTSL